MNRRQKAIAMIDAARLVLRVYRMSRRTGIPFDVLMSLHIQAMKLEAAMLTTVIYQHDVAEQARRN